MKMILNGYPHYDKSNLQRLNSKGVLKVIQTQNMRYFVEYKYYA